MIVGETFNTLQELLLIFESQTTTNMLIHKKTKEQVNPRILAKLVKFKNAKAWKGLTNVTLNQHITSILSKFVAKHEPVRSSFEYQLFLSIARDTDTYKKFIL